MSADAPYLLVRAASLYLSAAAMGMAWAWRRPSARAIAGGALATAWNLPSLLAIHLVAARFDWWTFDARGGLLLGMPVDLYLAWACLWGFVPALAFPTLRLGYIAALALGVDLILMPLAAPVVRLGPWWLVGEIVAVSIVLLPAQLLARWTTRDEQLAGRAMLQVMTFGGLVLFMVPAIAIDSTSGAWLNPLTRPLWQTSLFVQLLAVPALLGLTAVQEFVTRGGGTPVPFDPPRQLVTTGVYAYVRNPMQISGVAVLLVLGVVLVNPWISAAGVVAHLYSLGLAGWDEDEDLRRRFGDDWLRYRGAVRPWVPRFRPWIASDSGGAQLFVADRCEMCREVAGWFARRGVRGLAIVAAESHPSAALTRITYEPADGSHAVVGVEAIARALEHIHFGWALLGFALRLPVVRALVQLLADASGAEPRRVASTVR